MSIRATIRFAVAGPALAVGLALAIPAAASATTATPGAHVIKDSPSTMSASRPSAITPDVNNFWTYDGQGQTGDGLGYACVQGGDYLASDGWPFLTHVLSVKNNCEYRVYLQYANGTSDCVNPKTSRNIVDTRFQDPDGVMIGNSTANC